MLIASTSEGKIQEITKVLHFIEGLTINIGSLKDYPTIPEPDEPFDNLMENAIHKAKYYAIRTNTLTLSEDSGLSIEALDGFPGVKTKDLIIECGGVSQAFSKLESLLSRHTDHTGYFSTAVVLYIPSHDLLITHEAKVYGTIVFPPRGEAGFGFDPIFVPAGYHQTFSELGIELKTKISHRAQALHGLIQKFQAFLKQESSLAI